MLNRSSSRMTWKTGRDLNCSQLCRSNAFTQEKIWAVVRVFLIIFCSFLDCLSSGNWTSPLSHFWKATAYSDMKISLSYLSGIILSVISLWNLILRDLSSIVKFGLNYKTFIPFWSLLALDPFFKGRNSVRIDCFLFFFHRFFSLERLFLEKPDEIIIALTSYFISRGLFLICWIDFWGDLCIGAWSY